MPIMEMIKIGWGVVVLIRFLFGKRVGSVAKRGNRCTTADPEYFTSTSHTASNAVFFLRNILFVFFTSFLLFGCSTHEQASNRTSASLADVPPPALDTPVSDAETLRLGPVPRPKPDDVSLPFPPPESAPQQPKHPPVPPLDVIGVQPQGAVETVNRIVVRFNQPMVPVASVGVLDQAVMPLEIEPKIAGRMRWLDTQTLVFETPQRLPFATKFTATVPAGATSALGKKLKKSYRWSFETPAPKILDITPSSDSEGLALDAALQLVANVPLDKGFVRAASLRTEQGRGVPFNIRPAPKIEGVPPERTALLVPRDKLTPGTHYQFKLAAGWSTEEGPKPGIAFSAKFTTYERLKVNGIRCAWGWYEKKCPPYQPLVVELNNEPEAKQKPRIEIIPAVEGFAAEIRNGRLSLLGNFRPETTYRITVKKGLRDRYGQMLSEDHTFKVSFDILAPRFAFGGDKPLQVIEADRPILRGWAVNVPSFHVRAAPLDVNEWLRLVDGDIYENNALFAGRHLAIDRIVKGSPKNGHSEVTIPLDEALSKGRGLALVAVTAQNMRAGEGNTSRILVQATDLGLLAAFSDSTVQVKATGLHSGEEIEGASLELVDKRGVVLARAKSDDHGRASLSVPVGKTPFALVGRYEGNTSILPLSGNVNTLKKTERIAYLFTDRGVYRPGETVYLSALVRDLTPGSEGDLQPSSGGKVPFSLRDPYGREVQKELLTIDAHGFAHFEWKVPKDAMLGEWGAVIKTAEGNYAGDTDFRIEEYRTPELKVQANLSTEHTPAAAGASAIGSVDASYYFGGPVMQRPVSWTLTRTPTQYTPPNNEGFHFGMEHSYWEWDRYSPSVSTEEIASGDGTLDAQGHFSVPLELKPGVLRSSTKDSASFEELLESDSDGESSPPQPSDDSAWTYVFEASVEGANRQSIAGRSSVVAHRSLRRVGMRLSNTVLQPGEQATVEVVAVNLDGTRVKGVPVTVTLVNNDAQKKKESVACQLISASEPVSCHITRNSGGSWRVVATAKDAAGREDRAASFLWVVGGISTNSDNPKVEIIADKPQYKPGETARLLVRSPFIRAKGLLVVGRDGFAKTIPLDVTNGSTLVDLPISEVWLPGVTVQATLVSPRLGSPKENGLDPLRPRAASGRLDLSVASDSRRLITNVKLSKEVAAPREPITVDIVTRRPDGKPVPTQVTVMVVDEAVLALTGYSTPDPAGSLYPFRLPDVDFTALQYLLREPGTIPDERQIAVARSQIASKGLLSFNDAALAAPEAKKMEEQASAPGIPSPQIRSDFVTTPYFLAKLETDGSGKARTTFTLPDNLTQFRVMVVSYDNNRLFGSAEASVTSRLPLQVRPALPRFLNLGDTFTASAVVDNHSDSEADVVVRMLAANAEVLETQRTVHLAPGESKEVHFPVRAGVPGPAKFQVAAKMVGNDKARDAAEVVVPTLIPATAEAFATYGSTNGSLVQPVQRPSNALPGFGGLEVQLSSTALSGLRDAVDYLAEYPYGCTEQLSSELVPYITLKDVFSAFGLKGKVDPDKAIRATLKAIEKNRRLDNGFGYWPDSRESSLHLTAWVALVMQEAQKRGLLKDREALTRTLNGVEVLLRNPPEEWERRPEPRTLAALVLARAGRANIPLLEELSRKKLPLFVRAWLAEAWHLARVPQSNSRVQEQLRILRNAAMESAGTLHFAENETETTRLLLHSSELTDAIVLHALLTINPEDPMVDKLARGLSEHRRRGHWGTTHADAWAVLAMSELFRLREGVEPKFDARLWLGDNYIGGRAFAGRELTVSQLHMPMDKVPQGTSQLLLAKEGPGRLYWRVGLRYAPADLKPKALDQGFVVSRSYEPLDPGSVSRDSDGTWHIKVGTRVRVRLSVVVPDRRYHVALVDPMPAGFEAENDAFATTARIEPDDSSKKSWWSWSPWTHSELRDDRAQAFAEELQAGSYEFSWVARATTPGHYIAPPARAEEMYAPETFGRSAADTVVVK